MVFFLLFPVLFAQLWVFSHPILAFTDLHNHTQVKKSACNKLIEVLPIITVFGAVGNVG